jgi:hypothetical protein
LADRRHLGSGVVLNSHPRADNLNINVSILSRHSAGTRTLLGRLILERNHRSNGRARLLPSVRVVQLGRSLALPCVRLIVVASMRHSAQVRSVAPTYPKKRCFMGAFVGRVSQSFDPTYILALIHEFVVR